MAPDPDSKSYRPGASVLAPAVIFTALGLGFFIYVLFHIFGGSPMMVSNRGSSATHPASQFELYMMALGGLITAVLGTLTGFAWKNVRIVTNAEGIRGTDLFGRQKFLAWWPDLERLEEGRSKGRPYYTIRSRNQRLNIDPTFVGYQDLIESIKNRAPQMVRTDYP